MHLLNTFIVFILIISCTVATGAQTDDVDEAYLSDYYLELIQNRSQEVLDYEYPTDARMYKPEDTTVRDYGEYDFIIIGAGTTGCIVANRLSEVKDWKILLLEAGTYPDGYLTGIPSLFSQDGLSDFNWGFKSVPQKYGCLGNVENRCLLHRGKGIGGTSLINGLVYSRGSPSDYQKWAELVNDTSFNYENILSYFIKAENFTRRNPYAPIATEYRGYEGPLHTTHTLPPTNFSSAFLLGNQEMGYDIIDYNGPKQIGGSIAQYYLKNGRRNDPGKAYISTITDRSNLEILDKSIAIKLEIIANTNRAEGVIFTRNNKTYIARNRKEIIVSTGAISSPQLLMLSGIGPQEHLQSLGIPVIQNLPVGETLHDHPLSPITFSSNFSSPTQSLEESVREYLKGEGALTKSFLFDAIGWYKTPNGAEDENNPDTEIVFSNFSGSSLSTKTLGWTNETYNVLVPDVPNPISIILSICHPKSSGSIKLESSDPYEYPRIDSNILSNDKDVDLLYESLQVTLKLTETEALRKFNISVVPSYFPECKHTELLSKDFWHCYFRRATTLAGHVMGSCVTGASPETAVVDNELKVFGVKNLRIVDSSVIPFALADHPVATLSMLAEKITDQIKREYGK